MIYALALWSLVLSAVALAGMSIWLRRFRAAPVAAPLAVLCALCAVWAAGYALDVSTTTLSIKLIWFKLRFLAIPFVPLATLWLARRYTGAPPRHRLAALAIVPAITSGLALTTEHHTWFRYAFGVARTGPLPILTFAVGPWYWLHLAYSYGLALTAWSVLARRLWDGQRRDRLNTAALLAGCIIPTLADGAFQLGLTLLPGFNGTPSLFALSSAVYAWALFRHHLLDVVPFGRSAVMDHLGTPVVVLGRDDRIADFNPAASREPALGAAIAVGRRIGDVLPAWAELGRDRPFVRPREAEVSLGSGGARRLFELTISPVRTGAGIEVGCTLVFRDVSDHRQAAAVLRRYELLAKHGRDIVLFVRRADGRILEVNRAACAAYGYPRDELTSMTIYDLRAPATVSDTAPQMTLADEQGHRFETAHRRKDGTCFAVEVSAAGVDLDGERVLVSVVRDITNRKRLEGLLQRENGRLGALLDVAQGISQGRGEDEIVQSVLENAVQLTGSQIGYLHFLNDDQNTIRLHAWSRDTLAVCRAPEERHYPVERAGVWADAVRTRAPVVHNDLQALPGRKGYPAGHCPVVRQASAPVVTEGQVRIVLGVGNKPTDYDEADTRTLSLLAEEAWKTIENQRLVRAERRLLEELQALQAGQEDVLGELELPRLLEGLTRRAVDLMGAREAELVLHREEHGDLETAVSFGQDRDHTGDHLSFEQGALGQVARTRRSMVIEDYSRWAGRPRPGREGQRTSVAAAPLLVRGELVGALAVGASVDERRYGADDLRLLEMFARQGALAIQNARLFQEARRHAERMQELAITDPLTSLHSRRHFFDLGLLELDKARRHRRPTLALMMDIDHFKAVNDTYGHAVGDRVLAEFAAVCRSSLRSVDLLCRYGGEEFAALLPETTLEDGRIIAERLRRAVEQRAVIARGTQLRVTVSIGIAAVRPGDSEVEAVLERADSALYDAKERGRNCVCAWATPSPAPRRARGA